jgi:hypothetical protein
MKECRLRESVVLKFVVYCLGLLQKSFQLD